MLTGELALAEEDRALQLVTQLVLAGAGPTMIKRLMGNLVGEPQIKHRYRIAARQMAAADLGNPEKRRGAPPGVTHLQRLPKDKGAVLSRVLQHIFETEQGGFRADGGSCLGRNAHRIRVELLLAGWGLLRQIALNGPVWLRQAAAEITFEHLERADHFVFREQSVGLAICANCEAPNLRLNSQYVLCCSCNRRVTSMLNIPIPPQRHRATALRAA